MHEISMIHQMAQSAEDYAEQNGIEEVKFLNMEIGELAGVYPEIFIDYFPIIAEEYPALKNAKLKIRPSPGEGLCLDCHSMYNVMKYEGECPRCHSHMKKILGGREVKLISIGY